MNVQRRNDVSIYCLSSGPLIPEWLGERGRRNLAKKDESVRRRIELIQDFQMPASSSKLVQSADGRYIIAAGTYPPRIRCYDLHELTMKFERYVVAEVLDIVMLGQDYGKVAMLMDNRTIDFHAPYGAHESIRIPTFGRGLAYEPSTCELLVAAKGNQIYRINLDEGRFCEPWTCESEASATCITVNQAYPLAAAGCDDGIIRFWDNRSSDSLMKPFLKLDVQIATAGYGYADESQILGNPNEITSIAQDPTGMYLAAGSASGVVALYDVRSSRPLHIQEHKHGFPVHSLKFHSGSGMILSSDEKLVKIWRYKSSGNNALIKGLDPSGAVENMTSSAVGSVMVNIEGKGKLSHFITAGDESDPTGDRSGIILCTSDQPKMECFYVPALGVAPKWCSFLENITEELEERDLNRDSGAASDLVGGGRETIYENYKFVTRDEVETLGISNLVGTPLLKGYMHGFFMDINLYNRVKAVANPFEYEQYQKKKLKEKLEAKRASRIAPLDSTKQKKAVNQSLAERLQSKSSATTKAAKLANQVLSDNRFGNLFTNPDFEIDEEDENFKLRNPSGVAASNQRRNNLDSDDEDEDTGAIGDESKDRQKADYEDHSYGENDESDNVESDSEDDGFDGAKVRGEAYEEVRKLTRKKEAEARKKAKKKVIMKEADSLGELGLGDEQSYDKVQRKLQMMNLPLSERLPMEAEADPLDVRTLGGSKEVRFVPKDVKRKLSEAGKVGNEGATSRGKHKRRGVKELKLRKHYASNK